MSDLNAAQVLTENPGTLSLTPMLRQYLGIKAEHPNAILFYRLGDFYEMFFEDATEASKLLDLTLTARNKKDDNPVPLCGIPYHAAEAYIAKLVEHGKKVVICEQVEDPKLAKGIVRREVTRVITPGTVMESGCLNAKLNNHLLCILPQDLGFACVLCDVSTGKLEYFYTPTLSELHNEIIRLEIREIIFPESFAHDPNLETLLKPHAQIFRHALNPLFFDADFAADTLIRHYGVSTVTALGLHDHSAIVSTLGGLLGYLNDAKMLTQGLMRPPTERVLSGILALDETTLNHLELFRTQHEQKRQGSLIWYLDQCHTPMGARLLADWLRHPLQDIKKINQRLDGVLELTQAGAHATDIANALQNISDLERLANRFVTASANARDALALAVSLNQTAPLKNTLAGFTHPLFKTICTELFDWQDLITQITATITDDPPLTLREGGLIRSRIHPELDELRAIEASGKGFILKIESQEREKTGINSLKIRYNNVFGYYIEITNAHKDKVPPDYIRKQTLSNAERYITPELKEYEAKVLSAGERIKTIEYEIFQKLRADVAAHAATIRATAHAVATLDILAGFAELAKELHLTRPTLTSSVILDLKGARHPILEKLHPSEKFVPNDVFLDQSGCHQMTLTGPNMAGKSTLMRMVALTTILAQVGSFVPCEAATVGVCDRIFTRVGAHDHLQKGLSTFMVEMVETAKILREATPKSLILLDEIGRGTSTFDGLSIAWAVAEDLHDRLKARTLFATHYHELCDLAEQKKGIGNFHMAVREWNGEILFLRKLNPGGTNRSYGVVVGGMAGLPQNVVKRAREILKLLELKDLSFQEDIKLEPSPQLSLFEKQESAILKELQTLNVNAMTPLEALALIAEWKKRV